MFTTGNEIIRRCWRQIYRLLVSKELNHFGVIAGLFRQIGGHSSRFVLFCFFWRLFTIKMIKSVNIFSFWKLIIFFLLHKNQTPSINMQKWPPSDLTPWTLTLSNSLAQPKNWTMMDRCVNWIKTRSSSLNFT